MFSRLGTFSSNYWFTRPVFEKLVSDLDTAGFCSINIMLPHNLVEGGKDLIPVDDFLDSERNYPSLILIAQNEHLNETIKVFLVNISKKAFFKDSTFPSGHSERPGVYVQSPDPARTHSLFEFFYNYLTESGRHSPSFLGWLFYGVCLVFMFTEVVAFFGTQRTLLQDTVRGGMLLDMGGVMVAIFGLYNLFQQPKGLYIRERPKKSLVQYANMAITGELRDNPLANLVLVVLGTVLATLILRLLGL